MGFIKVPAFSQDLLVLPVYPDSCLYRTDAEEQSMDCYSVAGIKLTPIGPMKQWHIEYRGKMHPQNDPKKSFDVTIDAVWTATLPYFNYSTDISHVAMSDAVAQEEWTRQYFEDLQSHHQTHFEQYGLVCGTACIEGNVYDIKTSGLRDHTFGLKRDWNQFQRYAIHFIQLENGDAITVGVVCAPIMFSR